MVEDIDDFIKKQEALNKKLLSLLMKRIGEEGHTLKLIEVMSNTIIELIKHQDLSDKKLDELDKIVRELRTKRALKKDPHKQGGP